MSLTTRHEFGRLDRLATAASRHYSNWLEEKIEEECPTEDAVVDAKFAGAWIESSEPYSGVYFGRLCFGHKIMIRYPDQYREEGER